MQTKKVAIITGASRGIGHEIAYGLAEDGYNLILIARTERNLLQLSKDIAKFGIQTKIIAADVTNFDYLQTELNKIISEWGRLDILVNNAGIYIDGSLETSIEAYQELFNINFLAQLACLKTVLPTMTKQKSGHVFNIASLAGKEGYAGKGAYCSSKFAFVGLSEALYEEYSKQGIKITAICPSYVATDMSKRAVVPENEMIQAKDILQTIRWLLLLSNGAFVKEVVLHTAN